MSHLTPDTELLAQRFVDSDLSPEERLRFLALLGRSESLRQYVIDLEQLVADVERLPKPRVPAGFATTVLARTHTRPSVLPRVRRLLFAPHDLQWNVAGAAVACVIAIGIAAVLRTTAGPQVAPPGTPAQTANAPTAPKVLVRLVVVQPGARTVQVAGDFNGWDPERMPLEQTPNGAWTVTIPLEPGRYEYMYLINGQDWIGDPFAAEHNADGFGSRNAVLDVRADPLGAS